MSTANATAPSTSKRTKVKGVKNLFMYAHEDGSKSFYLLASINGKQFYEKLAATNKTEAEQERNVRVGELRADGKIELRVGEDLLFSELATRFIEHERGPSGKLTARTTDLREQLLERHVLPALGDMKARSITTPHVQSLTDRLTKQGLSGSSVRGIVTSISCVLGYGARYGHVASNPCREVALPSAARTTEPRYLTHAEVLSILEQLGEEFRPIAASAFYGALRISEVLALTWDAVDFDKGRIDVRQGKTKASVNTAPLPLPLAKLLREHRQRQVDAGLFEIGGLVFKTRTGRPQSRRNCLRAVNVASKAVGLWSDEDGREPVGLHDLRHSAAAFYFGQGVKTREVSRLLRHANPNVTMTVYSGIAPAEQEEILDGAVAAFA